jgi:hypothetical protein
MDCAPLGERGPPRNDHWSDPNARKFDDDLSLLFNINWQALRRI